MTQLKGKNVLITGGASGIGKVMAEIASKKEVANLVIWDYNNTKLQETVSELRQFSPNVHALIVDVSDLNQIISASAKTKAIVGEIDVLINNAGILIGKYFHEHSHDDIFRGMSINANAYMHVTSEFLPGMLRKGTGHICNVASAAGMLGNPRMSVYCASKSAVIGWSDSMRLELKLHHKSQVKVTIVTPNYVHTEMIPGVKSLVPILKKEEVAKSIIRAIETNKTFLRLPGIVYTLPFLKGVLPYSFFDVVVGKMLGVYKTMYSFSEK